MRRDNDIWYSTDGTPLEQGGFPSGWWILPAAALSVPIWTTLVLQLIP